MRAEHMNDGCWLLGFANRDGLVHAYAITKRRAGPRALLAQRHRSPSHAITDATACSTVTCETLGLASFMPRLGWRRGALPE